MIKKLIATEITPKLDDLREKKRVLLEFQKINSELENLQSLLIAYDYINYEVGIFYVERDIRLARKVKVSQRQSRSLEKEKCFT